MTTESQSATAGMGKFEGLLSGALARGRRWDFDEPSEAAITKARSLLGCIAEKVPVDDRFDVTVAVDGAIEIYASSETTSVTIEVEANGRVAASTVDHRTREITWIAENPVVAEMIREIERTA